MASLLASTNARVRSCSDCTTVEIWACSIAAVSRVASSCNNVCCSWLSGWPGALATCTTPRMRVSAISGTANDAAANGCCAKASAGEIELIGRNQNGEIKTAPLPEEPE